MIRNSKLHKFEIEGEDERKDERKDVRRSRQEKQGDKPMSYAAAAAKYTERFQAYQSGFKEPHKLPGHYEVAVKHRTVQKKNPDVDSSDIYKGCLQLHRDHPSLKHDVDVNTPRLEEEKTAHKETRIILDVEQIALELIQSELEAEQRSHDETLHAFDVHQWAYEDARSRLELEKRAHKETQIRLNAELIAHEDTQILLEIVEQLALRTTQSEIEAEKRAHEEILLSFDVHQWVYEDTRKRLEDEQRAHKKTQNQLDAERQAHRKIRGKLTEICPSEYELHKESTQRKNRKKQLNKEATANSKTTDRLQNLAEHDDDSIQHDTGQEKTPEHDPTLEHVDVTRRGLIEEQKDGEDTRVTLEIEQLVLEATQSELEAEQQAHEETLLSFDVQQWAYEDTRNRLENEEWTHNETKSQLNAEQEAHKITQWLLFGEEKAHEETQSRLAAEEQAHESTRFKLKTVYQSSNQSCEEQKQRKTTKKHLNKEEKKVDNKFKKNKGKTEQRKEPGKKSEVKQKSYASAAKCVKTNQSKCGVHPLLHERAVSKTNDQLHKHAGHGKILIGQDDIQEKIPEGVSKNMNTKKGDSIYGTSQKAPEDSQSRLDEEKKAHEDTRIVLEVEQLALEVTEIELEAEKQAHNETLLSFDVLKWAYEDTLKRLDDEQRDHEKTRSRLEAEQKAHEDTRIILDVEQLALEIREGELETEQEARHETLLSFDVLKWAYEDTLKRLEDEQQAHEKTRSRLEAEQKAHKNTRIILNLEQLVLGVTENKLKTEQTQAAKPERQQDNEISKYRICESSQSIATINSLWDPGDVVQDTVTAEQQPQEETRSKLPEGLLDSEMTTYHLSDSKVTMSHVLVALEDTQYTLEIEQRAHEAAKKKLNEAESTISELREALKELRNTCHEEHDWILTRNEIEMSEKMIGKGAWGDVMEGRFRGSVVAIKQIRDIFLSPHNRRLFEREMSIALKCGHPCLLQLVGATNDNGKPLIVTELLDTNLRAVLQERALEPDEITTIALDVARALNYLHLHRPHPIIHRDISSVNVLLWKRGEIWRAKISEYGAANFMEYLMTANVGAAAYAAPEAQTSMQSPMVDVYSYGVLVCEMSIRELPEPQRRNEQVAMVTNSPQRDLIRRCLRETPEERPSMEETILELERR